MNSFIDIILEVFLLNIPESLIILGFCIPLTELKKIEKSNLLNVVMVMSILSSIMVRVLPTPMAQAIGLVLMSLLVAYMFSMSFKNILIKMVLCMMVFFPIVESAGCIVDSIYFWLDT